jgi:hypothetical protein
LQEGNVEPTSLGVAGASVGDGVGWKARYVRDRRLVGVVTQNVRGAGGGSDRCESILRYGTAMTRRRWWAWHRRAAQGHTCPERGNETRTGRPANQERVAGTMT